ncbi:MAG: MBL fold metallo-hydrolase [Caldisericia bacterium]|nr:MBL fold metallo-hydrolase [Caldisericia bacterium]
MELVRIKEGIFFIKDTTNLPLFEAGSSFYLIDAPIDKDKAKKVKRIIEENNFNIKNLILTHHHADHTGGGKYLKEALKLKTFSTSSEKIFIENPILEPIYLNLGGNPPKEFLNKWVLSEGVIIDEDIFSLKNENFKIIDLSGHSIGMIGILIDKILFSSDSFFSKQVLEKYIVPYFHSYYKFIKRMEEIKEIDFDFVIPSHGDLYNKDDSIKIIDENIEILRSIKEKILDIIKDYETIENIIYLLNLNVNSYIVANLIKSSILSLLNEMKDIGEVEIEIKKGVVFFKKI